MKVPHLPGLRLIAGVAAVTAALAVVFVIIAVGSNSEAPSASATGPVPTKIANDGTLGGVVDILIHQDATEIPGLFHCIGKVDHEESTDLVKTALQCYIDVEGLESQDAAPSWAEVSCINPACPNPDLQNPSEPGPDELAGPPPPPPYTISPPDKAFGQFYPNGDTECDSHLPIGPNDPCWIQTVCIEDLGVVVGPNIIIKAYLGDPEDLGGLAPPNDVGGDGKSHGSVDIYYNQANSSCKSGTPKGTPFLSGIRLTQWAVYDKAGTPNASSPWRIANSNGSSDPTHDFDGDGCWDLDELDKSYVDPGSGVKCGDDPYNPSDSFNASTVDLTGTYEIVSRLARSDCSDPQNCVNTQTGGIYTRCLAELRHDTATDNLVMRPYCYADQTAVDINPEAFPGIKGDGFPGAPPPGPEALTTCPATCGEDPGSGNHVYGDVDTKHAELTGTFDPVTNQIEVAGCFIDEDGQSSVGDVWFQINVSAHQRPGSATIYLNQNEDCDGSPVPPALTSVVTFAKQPTGLARDDDQDGIPTSRELQDDSVCGRRDPFNKNDYYDVSIPRDGKIELFADVLLVIGNFDATGYPAGAPATAGPGTMENYDRPVPMQGSAGGWNRGSPDGKIELFVDVLGVIGQFNVPGCPPIP